MKFSIGLKLWITFISILLALVAVGSVGYFNTMKLTETASWVNHTHQVLGGLEKLLSMLKDAETGQRGYIITGEEQYLGPYQEAVSNVDRQLMSIKKLTADNPIQQQHLETITPLVQSKLDELKESISLRRDKGMEAARAVVLKNTGKAHMDKIRTIVQEMENEESGLLSLRNEEARTSAQTTLRSIIIGSLLACALVIGASLFLTQHISKPLTEIANVAERIASGDLSENLAPNQRTDEVGALIRAFSRMLQSLREMAEVAQQIASGNLAVQVTPQSEKDVLGTAFATMANNLSKLTLEIRDSIAVLTSSSTEILATTTQVASSATEAATAVSQTTTTVEEVKQTVQVASQKARAVSDSAQQTAQVSQAGREAVDQMIVGMNRIRQQTASTASSIARLGEQSQAISEIIASVNDLAEQSNLLAVNAAIEAAKAGEHGKGFAVVAQEIKSLAEQSKQATTQVRILLGDIQKATGEAVMATELNGKAVEDGARQSEAAVESIQMLAESIAESAQAAVQIAASSQQQLVGMDQVALAMENIKQASAQNMAGTRQAETAAKNLHEMGLKLESLVDRYQV